MTVVETHQVGRLPARSADLDDLARPLRLAHDAAAYAEPVPHGCLHPPASSPAFPRYRAPEDTLTVPAMPTVSIHPGADGRYRPCGYCPASG